MPVATDIISTTIIQELDGVQMSNQIFWQVDSVGADPTTENGLIDVLNAYYDSVKAFMSDEWNVVCGVYENISNPEGKAIVFSSLPGLSATDSHPQDQVLRLNSYGKIAPPGPIHRNAFNQSGVIESLSTDGRINNPATIASLKAFLTAQQVMPGGNWTIDPQVRWQTAPGPPATYAFANAQTSQFSQRLFKLRTRKTKLCLVA